MAHVILLLLAGTQHVPQNLRTEPQHALAEQIPSHPRQRVALDLVYFSSRMCSLTIELSEGKLIGYRPSFLSRHRRLLAIWRRLLLASTSLTYIPMVSTFHVPDLIAKALNSAHTPHSPTYHIDTNFVH